MPSPTLAVIALLALTATLPLWHPTIPPLNDLPGHMGRYAVQLAPDTSPLLTWFRFDWQVIGNLGVDLLIIPLSHVVGIETGTRIIVFATIATTTAAMLWIAVEVHGRIPPTALIAIPFAYGNPFNFGFINYALSSALALLAFALWLRLGRTDRTRWRPLLFMPIAGVVWLAHTFGWGLLGVLCGTAELVRQRALGQSWPAAAGRTIMACAPMAWPLVALLIWRSGAQDMTGDWFDWNTKSHYLIMTLRDRWMLLDVLSLAVAFGVIVVALGHRAIGLAPILGAAAGALLIVFVLLPRIIFGSAYADMRLTPWIFAIALLAIRPARAPHAARALLAVALVFFTVRLAATTISYAQIAARWDRALPALHHVPRGSSVVAFTRWTCQMRWSTDRLDHLPAMAMVRRDSFSNNQWIVSGANLLTVTRRDAPGFSVDPSQLTPERRCRPPVWKSLDTSLATFPRAAFDYVWLIDPPRHDVRLTAGLTPVWRSGTDVLYRVDRR